MDNVLRGIGPRLRAARKRQDRTIADVAEQSGMSASTLSRLESGQRAPNLELLLPLARVLGISLDDLVPPVESDPRVRHRARKVGKRTVVALADESSPVQTFKLTIPPEPGPIVPKVHEGREWMYVLSGKLRLILGEQDLILGPGEAADFDTQVPHWMGAATKQPVELISIFSRQGERIHTHASELEDGAETV